MTAAFWLLILHSTSSRPNSLALTIFSFVNCGTSQQVDPNSEKEKVKKKKKKKRTLDEYVDKYDAVTKSQPLRKKSPT